MIPSPTPMKGVVHGRTIELEHEPGFPDGQRVTVTVEPVESLSPTENTPMQTDAQERWSQALAEVANLEPGEGLRRSFGAWAEDAEELDAYLETNRRRRKLGRPGINL